MATSINTAEIPVSTIQSATAASYTIPADRYAIVRAGVHRGGTLSINGTVVLFSEDTSWNAIASATAVGVSGNSGNSASGNFLQVTSGGGGVNQGNIFTNSTARAFSSQHETTFKVPAGTVIVGSGTARYHIELYRIPGSAT